MTKPPQPVTHAGQPLGKHGVGCGILRDDPSGPKSPPRQPTGQSSDSAAAPHHPQVLAAPQWGSRRIVGVLVRKKGSLPTMQKLQAKRGATHPAIPGANFEKQSRFFFRKEKSAPKNPVLFLLANEGLGRKMPVKKPLPSFFMPPRGNGGKKGVEPSFPPAHQAQTATPWAAKALP